MPISAIREFLRLEAAGGILLAAAAAAALVCANSPADSLYIALLDIPVAVQIGALSIAKPLLLWINDGLMAIFFLLVGLEIKREVLEGELSSLQQATLPGIAAIGGMAAPAIVYAVLNWGDATALRGWAIPAATDIAFAVGVLTLLGRRAPVSLKIFLLALAIMDDLGVIVIIAIFYTADLSAVSLALAVAALATLVALNRAGVTRTATYVLVGVLLWTFVLKSGVHATLAGVALAFAIPLRSAGERGQSPLRRFEHTLHPWVTYAILPIFAFANAGVPLTGLSLDVLLQPVPLGILLGLFVGKQLGVMSATWLATKFGAGSLPSGTRWIHIYGMSLLTGIGFTMSLFIGTLAFDTPEYATQVRIAVLAGSLLSAITGYLVLRAAAPAR
ncbi:MAG: Na(+)/H(+) antiporter NhaA [Candidatus Muproteobacteria bacterium RBG_16_60_9]|uniref:Na(+)/H(+) antiporter NhaA n=1 Tax=Candidatus Muproteobacteria bacterium RBG_16_60_9 TaxID=1817755 RepID=A0A1F6UZH0_9PROT|nr:MAG: Na(+)/H(+) antiporter NhaA [Candidatus Muproteobacteria bacterium RBG_16_60_9]